MYSKTDKTGIFKNIDVEGNNNKLPNISISIKCEHEVVCDGSAIPYKCG